MRNHPDKEGSLIGNLVMKTSIWVMGCKRAMDIIIGGIGSVAFLLCYPFIAFLIRRESAGPVLYAQERIGLNRRRSMRLRSSSLLEKASEKETLSALKAPEGRGPNDGGRPFRIYKFRTMHIDAEAAGPQLCAKGADPRVTRIGGILRSLHLDELPQFWNILKGDMSFIGPRPERAYFVRQYSEKIPHYFDRTLHIRPGLTGFAQIAVGYDDSMESVVRKTHYDLAYRASLCCFTNWVRMELWILTRTVFYLLNRQPLNTATPIADWIPIHPEKTAAPGEPEKAARGAGTSVKIARRDRGMLFSGENPVELGRLLENHSFIGGEKLEVYLNPKGRLDLEDLGNLVKLAQQVKAKGGTMAVKNNHPKVQKLMREIHLDRLVDLYRTPSVKNFITIDVECWFHAYNMRDKVPRSSWEKQPTRIVENIRRILDLLKAHNVKATFFVLGWVADQFPQVVQMIDVEGHEIGTHGYSHNLVTEMTPADFEADLVRSLNAIAKYSMQKVIGHRASNFTVVESTLWALDILAKYGIEYDSSIFPIGRARYGIPDYANRLPHTIELTRTGRTIREIPLSTMELGKRLLPISGGGYLRLYPYSVTERYIDSMNRKGEPAVLYFHPWELDVDQRRVDAGLIKSFQHYVNTDTTEEKIHRLLRRFSFTSIKDNMEERRIQFFLKRNPVRLDIPSMETDASADSVGSDDRLKPTESGIFTAF